MDNSPQILRIKRMETRTFKLWTNKCILMNIVVTQ